MRDVVRSLIAMSAGLMWLAIACVFIVGTKHIAQAVFGQGGSERWPVVAFVVASLGLLAVAANLFFAHYFGLAIGTVD